MNLHSDEATVELILLSLREHLTQENAAAVETAIRRGMKAERERCAHVFRDGRYRYSGMNTWDAIALIEYEIREGESPVRHCDHRWEFKQVPKKDRIMLDMTDDDSYEVVGHCTKCGTKT